MSFVGELKEYLVSASLEKSECCREAFLRGKQCEVNLPLCEKCDFSYISGIFYACGSITTPEKGNYLYIAPPPLIIETVNAILEESSIPPKRRVLRKKQLLYYKKNTEIADFLTNIGAVSFSMRVMEAMVIRDMRNAANRITNAEYSNMDRAMTAAAEQICAIRKLEKHGKLNLMANEYILTARLRTENPELNLEMLSKLFDPPITKSGLNHRLQRLIAEADKINE